MSAAADLAGKIAGHLPVFARPLLDKLIAAVRKETIAQIAECRAVTTTGPHIAYCATCGHHQRTDRACSVAAMQEYPLPGEAFAALRVLFGDYFDGEQYAALISAASVGGKTRTAGELAGVLAGYAEDSITAEMAEG